MFKLHKIINFLKSNWDILKWALFAVLGSFVVTYGIPFILEILSNYLREAEKLSKLYFQNILLQYLIFELTFATIFIIKARSIIATYRSRSLALHNKLIYSIISLIFIVGFIVSYLLAPKDSRIEIILTFITLIFSLPAVLEFMNKNRGIWRIMIYPTNINDNILYPPDPKSCALIKLNKQIEITINARNLKSVDASISFFGIFNDTQLQNFNKNISSWQSDFLLKNYLTINCIKRIETPYENVPSFGQSTSNTITFIPLKSDNTKKIMMKINDENYGTSILLNKDEVENGLILHFIYLDIFNKVYDYPLCIRLK